MDRALAEMPRHLEACATEADIVQVLYTELQPLFHYDIVNMHVLEHDGWFHNVAVERGVLQDMRRGLVAESHFRGLYENPVPQVLDIGPRSSSTYIHSRGSGAEVTPRLAVWVPLMQRGEAVGAVIYQLYEPREVPDREIAVLEQLHGHLGVLAHNAYLNALSRNQATSLQALNTIGHALSGARQEHEVAAALASTLRSMLAVQRLDFAVLDEEAPDRVRLFSAEGGGVPKQAEVSVTSTRLAGLREILREGRPVLDREGTRAMVPLIEGETIRGAFSLDAPPQGSYEVSTLDFLKRVADNAVLALRNATSYTAIDAQRRRLAVVNTIGRRLAAVSDRWSIMRTLREELEQRIKFDSFMLALVEETSEGPVAHGLSYDSGVEQALPPIHLRRGGPSLEAYETGKTVLIRRSPWAASIERDRRGAQQELQGDQALVYVTRPRARRRVAARSMIWAPAKAEDRVTALLTLQSYTNGAFNEWHAELLEDVAAHVALALANAEHSAAAQAERQRLESLHQLDMGVARASNEAQIAEAFFVAAGSILEQRTGMLVGYLEGGAVGGWRAWGAGSPRPLAPLTEDASALLQRLMAEDPGTGVHRESVTGVAIWSAVHPDTRLPLASTPLRSGDRVTGVLVLGRPADMPFTADELRFLESAAPVVAISLRTVRLHQANEWALAQSVRLQEVASLAGHDLTSVAGSVAELARTMVNATGVGCWAFDDEGRVIASAVAGDGRAARILSWSGRSAARGWEQPPVEAVTSRRRPGAWTLLPLWYGQRLVGAIGALRPLNAMEDLGTVTVEFTRHAAIAIENARLAEETRGRIRTLEAVAAFGSLDLANREEALAGLGGLIADALSHVHGALWVLQGSALVDVSSSRPARIRVASPERLLEWIEAGGTSRELSRLFRGAGTAGTAERLAAPVLIGDDLAGVVAAGGREATAETGRLMNVLAAQAGVVLARLDLVARLDREAKTMDAVLSNSPVGVVLESDEGRIAFTNSAIERLYGLTESSLVGQRLDAIYRRSGARPVGETDLGPHTIDEIRLKDLVLEVRRVVIPGSGDHSERVLTLHEDVTQERRLQEAKDLMLRAIGHEVRSPAAAMRGTIASLLQWHEVMDAEQRQGLMESAYEQSQRLLALVESQLLISQLETGNFRPNAEQVALRRAMEDTMAVLRHRYSERAEVVEVQLPPTLSAAHCDATHLGQVLINVVGNALEYTHATRIVVTASEEDGWLQLTVRDNGGGVPPDRVDTLFSKLAPAGQKRARGGLGIGLYLCRLVVEKSFNGRIWLDETGPGGTTFKFTVPTAMAGVHAIAQ